MRVFSSFFGAMNCGNNKDVFLLPNTKFYYFDTSLYTHVVNVDAGHQYHKQYSTFSGLKHAFVYSADLVASLSKEISISCFDFLVSSRDVGLQITEEGHRVYFHEDRVPSDRGVCRFGGH